MFAIYDCLKDEFIDVKNTFDEAVEYVREHFFPNETLDSMSKTGGWSLLFACPNKLPSDYDTQYYIMDINALAHTIFDKCRYELHNKSRIESENKIDSISLSPAYDPFTDEPSYDVTYSVTKTINGHSWGTRANIPLCLFKYTFSDDETALTEAAQKWWDIEGSKTR